MLSRSDSSVELPSPCCQGLHHQIRGLVIREVVKQFPLKLSLPRVFQPCSKRQTKRQISPVKNGFSCHELTVSHLTLGASTSERGAGCSTHAVILKKGKRCQIVKMVESLYTCRVFGSIWKYRMQRFSWFTIHAAGANFERRRHDLLGRSERHAPPGNWTL